MAWLVEPLVLARDLDEVMAIETASFFNPWTRESFTFELVNSDVSHLFVVRAAVGGPVVGYCCTWRLFDELHLNHIAIRENVRGLGAGRALMRFVIDDAVAHGARKATLEVRRSNAVARHLYQTLGFVEAGVRRAYYREPEEDAIVLWCDLCPARANTGGAPDDSVERPTPTDRRA
jgi:[ribosomal protein S18]-alanine N-acetyltransferase